MYVVWGELYSKQSLAEHGTMFQLRILINRSGVPSNPEKNMKAAEDFLLLLIHAHVVVAADKLFEYDFGGDSLTSVAKSVAKSIVNTHLLLPASTTVDDGVTTYARELLTLGLIWLQFYDAVKEGDGDRILLCMDNPDTSVQGNSPCELS